MYTQDDEIGELKSKMDDMSEEFGKMLKVDFIRWLDVVYLCVLSLGNFGENA